jgi:hypothetical protein
VMPLSCRPRGSRNFDCVVDSIRVFLAISFELNQNTAPTNGDTGELSGRVVVQFTRALLLSLVLGLPSGGGDLLPASRPDFAAGLIVLSLLNPGTFGCWRCLILLEMA